MLTSEYVERIAMINNYFHSNYKWKFRNCEDKYAEWEYQYYKGYEKNLKELEFICNIIFSDMEFSNGIPIKNNDGNIIGACLIGNETIHPNMNGFYQGDRDYNVYIVFCLCQYGMWIHEARSQDAIDRYINEI